MAAPKATDDAQTIYQNMLDNNQVDYNWMILEVTSERTVKCVNTGLGIDNLIDNMQDDRIQWAVLVVLAVDQQDNVTSRRPKIVQLNWLGSRVPAMRRMGALTGKSAITSFAKGVHVSFECNEKSDITMVTIGKALLAAGGAHKPTHYEFGGDCSIALTELGQH
jgi:hypothetical protein